MTQISPKPAPQNTSNNGYRHSANTSLNTVVEDKTQVTPTRFKRTLRSKATALAIALSTLPVLAIGATAYYFANQAVIKQITQAGQARTTDFADQVNRFIYERYGDIQIISSLPIFTNPKLREITTQQEQQVALNRFLDAYLVYDNIAVFDLNGNLIAQSLGKPVANPKDTTDFRQAIATRNPVIGNPEPASTGEFVVHFAAPVKDNVTGQTIAVVRSRMPISRLEEVVQKFGQDQYEYHLVDATGKFFLAQEEDHIGKNAWLDFGGLQERRATRKLSTWVTVDQIDNAEQLVTYAPLAKIPGLPQLEWDAILATDTAEAFAPQRQLLTTLLLGTGLTALLVGLLAAYLANRATKPILQAAETVSRLGQGQLDSRIAVQGNDEVATLGSNINSMATRLQQLIANQTAEAKRVRILKDITVSLGQYPQVQEIFDSAVTQIRTAINSDRVVVYSFNERWQGTVIAESVVNGFPKALGANIDDPCFADRYVERYRQGRVQATNDIAAAGLTDCHIKQLAQFEVKANLVAPIVQNGKLLGLLIAHQCSAPRAWQQAEIDLFAQIAAQVGFALDRVALLEQQKTAKEQLQQRALELLQEVDPVSRGDLTIRAKVTADEIGTVADSYNATINSLRQIVTQVKAVATQMATTTSTSETSVQELSHEALRQTEEISTALNQIQEMSHSIQAVAQSAAQAEAAVQQANATVAAGDAAMNRTVDGIEAIRDTVTATTTKVKQLSESSRKISKVVNLIGRFAAQTNLLALKASIEAARAGEEGRGFAVLADEVRVLASQSAQATAEIEKLVTDIQAETNALAVAMEAGTEQVANGTRLVDETRQSLNQINVVSAQISELVQAIASAATVQSQTSEAVTQTMTDVAQVANHTSTEAAQVSATFKQLLEVADELQTSVGQFKVN